MNSEKVYFDIDLNFLLMFCLQKEYEQQVDVVDKEIRKNNGIQLGNVLQK